MMLFNLFYFIYLSLILLASSIWKEPLWGFNSWGFVSQTAGFIFFIILIAAYAMKKFSSDSEGAQAEVREAPRIPKTKTYLLISAGLIALFYILRMRHFYWGELERFATPLSSGAAMHFSSPAAVLINWIVYKFLNAVFVLDAISSTVFVSVISGVIFVLFAIHLVHSLEIDKKAGGFFLPVLFIASSGYAAVFFGEGGKAPLAILFVLLYLHYSIRFLKEKASLLGATIFFALALLSQTTCIYLSPSYIFLLILAAKEPKRKRGIISSLVAIASVLVLVQLIAPALYHANPPITHILRLSIASLRDSRWAEKAIALNNLKTLLNELLLIGPTSILALILLFTKAKGLKAHGKEGFEKEIKYFMIINVAGAIVVLIFSTWNIKQGLNWQILASLGPVFASFSLWKLSNIFDERAAFKRVVYIVALVSVFQTFPWIVVNSHKAFAEKRLLALPLEHGQNELIVAERYFDDKNFKEAKNWLKKSIEKNPAEAEAYYLLGKIYMHDEEYTYAVGAFTKATEIDSTNILYRFSLANAFIERTWYGDATTLLNKLVTKYPDSARFWTKLGYAYNHSGQFDKAIQAYGKALKIVPENKRNITNLVSALLNKGAKLQMGKKFDEARNMYLKAIQLYPKGWRAYNNLALIEIEEGNLDTAEKILKEVLNLHPSSPELNLNMGIVLEKQNRLEDAIKYMKRGASLSMFPSAIQDTIRKLEKRLNKK